jgi:hypothetical protein
MNRSKNSAAACLALHFVVLPVGLLALGRAVVDLMRARAFVSVVIEAEIIKFRNAHYQHNDYPPHIRTSKIRKIARNQRFQQHYQNQNLLVSY